MTEIILLVVVAVLIAGFSYLTNAGFGDRKPKELREKEKARAKAQASAAADDAPPPHK
ncbi:MAG: hypothetical protein JWN44_5334 [Myxococcales bacterium]|nr:hypothetical protein [Myxococcales bacterium]